MSVPFALSTTYNNKNKFEIQRIGTFLYLTTNLQQCCIFLNI